MKLTIKPMNYDQAKQISKWIYNEQHSIYSMNLRIFMQWLID